MKKTLSILSALVFLLGGAGYYLGFTAVDQTVKDEMRASIQSFSSQKNIVQLAFDDRQLSHDVRFTDSKEFIYAGKHYDIIHSQKAEGRTVFTCVSDVRETSLFGWFKKNLDQQSSKSANGKISFNPLGIDWFFQSDAISISIFASENFSQESRQIPISVPAEIPTPPPNC